MIKKEFCLGFTLTESLVATSLIVLILISTLGLFIQGLKIMGSARAKTTATLLAEERMEKIKNMPYDQIGTTQGWPTGPIPSEEVVNIRGINYTITTTVNFIDDPFDGNAEGTIPNKPQDTAPADYKQVEVEVSWDKYFQGKTVLLSTYIVPKGVETETDTGVLSIKVFDASGEDVPVADVHIVNEELDIDIWNHTDNKGNLKVMNLPPAQDSYQIYVSKDGYTSAQTYPPEQNPPPPFAPHASVIAGEITSVSFAIDKISGINISTQNNLCQPIANIPFRLYGSELIGTDPDILRYDESFTTDSQGNLSINNLKWDEYNIELQTSNYNLAGSIPTLPLSLLPDSFPDLKLILEEASPNSLLVTVKEMGTETPLSQAQVEIIKGDYNAVKITGQGFISQEDWSGGSGQENFEDETRYFQDDGNLDVTSTAGEITLKRNSQNLIYEEDFTTTTFKDEENTTADWDTISGNLKLPQNEAGYQDQAYAQSLKINTQEGIITKATLNAIVEFNNQEVHFYLSADDGQNFEEVTLGQEHEFQNVGSSLKWKIWLSTQDPSITPIIESLSLSYQLETYVNQGELISSTFNIGSLGNFNLIGWLPESQPDECGSEPIKFQIATSDNINGPFEFLGPDGTSNTYFTIPGSTLPEIHSQKQYLRYKVILSTQSPICTPRLSYINIGFTEACIPPGQVFFSNLESGSYQINVTKEGYQDLSETIEVNGTTQLEILLSPL